MAGWTTGAGNGSGPVCPFLSHSCECELKKVGSRYSLYLGSEARIVRLQAEHLRLSINSMALRASTSTSAPSSDEKLSACLRKALNAATSTIQTHFESSQTDLFLSFATDVSLGHLSCCPIFFRAHYTVFDDHPGSSGSLSHPAHQGSSASTANHLARP